MVLQMLGKGENTWLWLQQRFVHVVVHWQNEIQERTKGGTCSGTKSEPPCAALWDPAGQELFSLFLRNVDMPRHVSLYSPPLSPYPGVARPRLIK